MSSAGSAKENGKLMEEVSMIAMFSKLLKIKLKLILSYNMRKKDKNLNDILITTNDLWGI